MSRSRSISDWRFDAMSKTGPVKAAWKDNIRLRRIKGGLSHFALRGPRVLIKSHIASRNACPPMKAQLPTTAAQRSARVSFFLRGFGFCEEIRFATIFLCNDSYSYPGSDQGDLISIAPSSCSMSTAPGNFS